jgi:hypothetical protein
VDALLNHLLGLGAVLRSVYEGPATRLEPYSKGVMDVFFRNSLTKVMRYMLFRAQEYSKTADQKLIQLHHSLEFWSSDSPRSPSFIDFRSRTLCYLAHYAMQMKFQTRSSLSAEMMADSLARARHEYIRSLPSSSEILALISTLSQVDLNIHTESRHIHRFECIPDCTEYLETILIESTLRTVGDDQAKSIAVSSAISLTLIAANGPRFWWNASCRRLFLAGLVLAKSRFPQGTCSHFCSHLLEHYLIQKLYFELQTPWLKQLWFDSESAERAIALVPRFWGLADQCSSLQEIWCISCSGFTTVEILILHGRSHF